MRKLFASIIMMFMCAVAVFSGCNLVQTNTRDYYDRTVAEVNGVKVTKLDLLNSYYSALQNNSGVKLEDVLNELVDRQLIIQEVKENFKKYVEGIGQSLEDEDSSALDNIENKYFYNSVMKQVYDYLDEQILNYENSIRAAKGLSKIEEDEEEVTTDYKKEQVYEKKVVYENGEFVKVDLETEYEDEKVAAYDYLSINHGDTATRTLAYKRFIQSLIRSENGKGLDTNEQNVLQREMDRVYKVYSENMYNTIFEIYYEYNLPVDNGAIVNKYKQLVQKSYSEWAIEGEGQNAYDAYVKAMQSDASQVYYHPYENESGKGFIQVAHILIKFTDEQLNDTTNDDILSYKEITEAYENGTDNEETYQIKLNAWKEQCSGKARYLLSDEKLNAEHLAGNEYGEAINYKDIYNEIKLAVDNASTLQQKAEVINSFIYKYGQDEGSINSNKYYSISLDDTVTESWVDGFAETARDSFSKNGAGSLSEPLYVMSKDDKGNISYAGYHIIFVIDEYKNLCPITSVEGLTEDYALTLYNTRNMLGVDKSVYDSIFDTLTLSNFTTYRTNILDTIKEGKTITYYKDAYKDLM